MILYKDTGDRPLGKKFLFLDFIWARSPGRQTLASGAMVLLSISETRLLYFCFIY